MKTLEATFQIITPMFLGGAEQRAETVRPASVKGALRFWWRALNWSRCLANNNHDEILALRSLHDQEARLFGIAASDAAGGQGVFLLQVCDQGIVLADQPFNSLGNGQLYLLGQGLATFKNGNSCIRNAIKENGHFTVKLMFRHTTSDPDMQSIRDAVLLFGLMGALGSRARHGLGSVAITKWSGPQEIAQTAQEYQNLLSGLLKDTCANALPPFTAFSHLSRIDLSKTDANALKLLNVVGMEQQMYRSYGRNGKVNGQEAEQNFADDHDLILAATQGKRIDRAPKRVVFGLPHNYFFSSTNGKADVNYAPGDNDGRRASPLMLHLHPIGSKFVAVHTLLPAKFLPDQAQIRIKARGTSNVNSTPDWHVLHDYLNRFNGETLHGSR